MPGIIGTLQVTAFRVQRQGSAFIVPDGCQRSFSIALVLYQSVVRGVLTLLSTSQGGVQALEAVKLAAGVGKPLSRRLLLLDALDGRMHTVKLRARCHVLLPCCKLLPSMQTPCRHCGALLPLSSAAVPLVTVTDTQLSHHDVEVRFVTEQKTA